MSILVVGALHWDVVVDAPRLPHLDETLHGHAVAYRLGGKGGNQAIAAARAGASVAFAGRLGADDPGRVMAADLAAAGVDLSQLQRGQGASGMSVAIGTEVGDYGAVIVSAENHNFEVDRLRVAADCQIVLTQNEMAPGLLPVLRGKADAAGASFWVNYAPATPAQDWESADVLIVNRVEATDLLGDASTPPAAMAWRLLEQSGAAETVILTLGSDGLVMARRGAPPVQKPALSVPVVSTHGAGDAFVGTLAAARVAGLDWDQALDQAQHAAAALVSATR